MEIQEFEQRLRKLKNFKNMNIVIAIVTFCLGFHSTISFIVFGLVMIIIYVLHSEIKEIQMDIANLRLKDNKKEIKPLVDFTNNLSTQNTNNTKIEEDNTGKKIKKKSKQQMYIDSFKNLPIYDISKTLTDDFIKSLERNLSKEVEHDKFVKLTGTTMRPESFVVFDLETTGLSPISNEIIEIGAIRYEDGIPVEVFHTYIKPKKKITEKITKINGITNEMVEESPSIEDVLPQFINFIRKDILIAHNSSFDISFIMELIYKLGYKKLTNKVIDTLKLARQKVREYDIIDEKNIKLDSYKLESLKYDFDLYDLPSHNSLDDCKVCAYVYLEIIEEGGDMIII